MYHCGAKTKAIHCQNPNVSDVKIGPFIINYIAAMVRVSKSKRKIKTPEALEEMLLADKVVFGDIAGLSTDSLNYTFEMITGKYTTDNAVWRTNPVNQSNKESNPEEIEKLKMKSRNIAERKNVLKMHIISVTME